MTRVIYLIPLLVTLSLVAGCNKDKQLNKKMQAQWYANSVDGNDVIAGDTLAIRFISQGAMSGIAYVKQRYNSVGFDLDYEATYTIHENHITLIPSDTAVSPMVSYEIMHCNKYELELKNESGQTSLFEKFQK